MHIDEEVDDNPGKSRDLVWITVRLYIECSSADFLQINTHLAKHQIDRYIQCKL